MSCPRLVIASCQPPQTHESLSLLVIIIIFFFSSARTRKSSRKSCHVTLDRSLVSQKLNVGTIDQEFALLAFLGVFLAAKWGEAPVLGHDDLLAARELVLGAAEGFDCCCAVYIVPVILVVSRYYSLDLPKG